MGTPFYISPEQVAARPVDHRADIYSLGATYFHMIAGAVPFPGRTLGEIVHAHLSADPPSPREHKLDLPEWACGVVKRMLAKEPADRFERAADVAETLRRELSQRHPALLWLQSEGKYRAILLARGKTGIGRATGNAVCVPEALVSSHHAIVHWRQKGFVLQDRESRNGTLLNGQRVSEAALRHGDLISIGTCLLLLTCPYEARQEEHGTSGDASPYQLACVSGPGTGREFALPPGPALIGGHTINHIVLNDPAASLFHAQIYVDDDGPILSDLRSKTGTFVNGKRVLRERVQPGDTLRIGGCTLELHQA